MVASISYTYLGVNTFVRADYEQPDVRWDLITGSGSNPYAGLDDFGRQQNCLWRNYSGSPSDLVNLNYGFNLASSRQWREDTVAPSGHYDELYTYDDLQRLTEMERGDLNGGHTAITSPTLAQDWTLDPTGNWDAFSDTSGSLVQARDSNEGNQITDITESSGTAWSTPVYDLAGNMTRMPRPATLNLNYFLIYDAWNRIRFVDVSSGAPSHSLNSMYDGLNRRVTKAATGPPGHYYYSDQWQVVEERAGSPAVPLQQYVWGLRYVDDLILRDRDTGGGTLSQRLYSLQDANWNVVALSDTSGAVQERYVYTPYGVVTYLTGSYGSRSSSSYGWVYRFTGRESDNPVGYQLNRERVYHPNLGCWLTKDPSEYDAGDVNLYRYLRTHPIDGSDPTGLLRNCADCCEGESRKGETAFIKLQCGGFGVTSACNILSSLTAYLGSAETCAGKASKLALELFPGDLTTQQMFRHCYASACLTIGVSCNCARCIGYEREYWQTFCSGDQIHTVRDGQMGENNNRSGRQCAGCWGANADWGSSAALTAIDVNAFLDKMKRCCLRKLNANQLDDGSNVTRQLSEMKERPSCSPRIDALPFY